MSYRFDNFDRSIVIDNFEEGIANSPFTGISNMRNVNIASIPGEASVGFSTSAISQQPSNGNVTTGGSNTVTITGATFDSGTAIVFSGGSLPTGIVAGTTYWASGSSGVYTLYTDYAETSILTISGAGTGTWATINMGQPKYFTYSSQDAFPAYWMVDSNGRVWSNQRATQNNPFYWTYTGNQPNNNSKGNGIGYYTGSDGTVGATTTGYIFVFSDSSIDYTSTTTVSWVYQWNPATGTTGSFNANPTQVLKSSAGSLAIHETVVGPDNKFYYCDGSFIGRFYQTAIGTSGNAFVPTDTTKYTFDNTKVLPLTDKSQSLAFLGNNILIGGTKNIVYPWDTFSNLPNYPILVSESNIVKLITVNTNTYIFAGNRGRIYYTNGSQAQLFKKIPDHISGTTEPYYNWGGVTSNKNQLYFSMQVFKNVVGGGAGTPINQYGGLWAINLDTQALRLVNKLSYGTYAGYATAIIPNFGIDPAGAGLFIGWDSGTSTYGIDTTVAAPYTNSEATIDTDLIPIGTFAKPRDFERVEFRLTRPLVSGESIAIYARTVFNTSDTGWGSAIINNSTVGVISDSQPVNFKNAQWIQLQAVLSSTASLPSYVRLKEIRITGLQGQGPLQQIAL